MPDNGGLIRSTVATTRTFYGKDAKEFPGGVSWQMIRLCDIIDQLTECVECSEGCNYTQRANAAVVQSQKAFQEAVDLMTIMWANVRDHDCDDCKDQYEVVSQRLLDLSPAVNEPFNPFAFEDACDTDD